MIAKAIYIPSGRAKEYGDYALNIYAGCPHFCSYCYVPAVMRTTPDKFHAEVKPREGILEATKKQLTSGAFVGKEIFLCFTGDAYPRGCDTSITREIIKAIKDSGSHVRILTKGGLGAERDFDLLDENDWFGVTYAGYGNDEVDEKGVPFEESGASPIYERIATLFHAHDAGIKTWISMEPILNANDILGFLRGKPEYIDLFKIGKLNHKPSSIDWKAFGTEAERICIANGYDYYIKEDLRKEIGK